MTANKKTSYVSPYFLVTVVAVSVFIGKALTSFISQLLPPLPLYITVLVDASFQVVIISTVAHVIVFRPMLLSVLEQERLEIQNNKHAEMKMVELAAIVESSIDAVTEVDLLGNIITWNKSAECLFGYTAEEILGTPVTKIAPDYLVDEVKDIVKRVLGGESITIETVRKKKDGTEIDVILSASVIKVEGNVVGTSAILRDITERKQAQDKQIQLEEQLRQSQKMEALGRLAGRITQHFDDYLATILGNTEVLQATFSGNEKVMEHLNEISESSYRAAGQLRQIVAIRRMHSPSLLPIDISWVIDTVIQQVRLTLPDNIELTNDIQINDCRIMADPAQIHQLIMNLCKNATDAMEEIGGIIEISTKMTNCHECLLSSLEERGLDVEKCLQLTIKDTGCGIPKDNLQKVFDPFFTTQDNCNERTGLGLSIVHSIVESHLGEITVVSDVGIGTIVKVCLPVIKGEFL